MKLSSVLLAAVALGLPAVNGIAGNTRAIDAVYFVLFSDTATGPGTVRCAGVMITSDTVLTTAVCANAQYEYARVGYSDDGTSSVIAKVKSFHNHPNWSPNHNSFTNDMAIVVLDTFTGVTTFPVLNKVPYDLNDLGAAKLTVVGAGGQTSLVGVDVEVQDFKTCFDAYNNAKPQVVLNEDVQFCAGLENIAAGACNIGDMGAPLIVEAVTQDTDIVYGFASKGDCGKFDKPFVYTRMSIFIAWTIEAVCANSDDPFADCPAPVPAPTPPNIAPVAPSPAPVDPNTLFFSVISDTATGAGTYRCGGALIHNDIVVTSAECIKQSKFKKDAFYVRVGYTSDTVSAVVSNITAAVAYVDTSVPKQENLPNDIAIIKLATPVNGIAFPTLNAISAEPPDNGAKVYFASAGSASETSSFVYGTPRFTPPFSDVLQTGITATSQFIFCSKDYVDLPGYASKLQEGIQFCAAKGPCDAGVSGSPLWQIMESGNLLLVGLSSQGCCSVDSPPDIWTRISAYEAWIKAVICVYSASPPGYCTT